ncbi:MAG: hypothetical protein AB7Y46_08690 [Armatimonadota bacterium]
MSIAHFSGLLTDTHAPGQPVPSGQFNTVVRILDTQLVGALAAIGAGCLDAASWVVSAGTGLSVNISAGAGIVATEAGYAVVRSGSSYNLSGLPSNSTRYVRVEVVERVNPEDPDSREDGTLVFTATALPTQQAGSMVIAKVITSGTAVTVVEDLREFTATAQAAAGAEDVEDALDAIREAIGLRYFGSAAPPASVDARLSDLEAAGSEGGSGPVYWGLLQKVAGDPTTIDQQIDADIQAHVDAMHSGEQKFVAEAEPWDEDSVNHARHVLRVTRQLDGNLPDYLLGTLVICWGVYGDGSNGTPDFVDRENSTWLPA